MNPAKRSVILDNFIGADTKVPNVLCKTHADRLKMPKDWLLDDRREANPRLFRVATTAEQKPSRDQTSATGHRRKSRPFPKPESFDTVPTPRPVVAPEPEPVVEVVQPLEPEPVVVEAIEVEAPGVAAEVVEEVVAEVAPTDEPELEPTQAMPWKPRFDQEDDLDGVLKPKGRLLSRAFGSDETQFMQRPAKELQREPFDDIP